MFKPSFAPRTIAAVCGVALCAASLAGCGGGGGGDEAGPAKVLPVNLSLVGPAAGSDDTRTAIEDAVDRWKGIFSQAGVALDVQYYDFDGPRDLPDPREGDALYAQISGATRAAALNIVVGVDLDGVQGASNESFGLVGGSPGPTSAGDRSVAAFAITRVAGEDGQFNFDGSGATQLWGDEVEVASEVLGALAGEYLGLKPVVTFDGNKVVATDGLSDTESCVTEVECKNEDSPRDNLMFPRVYKKPGEGKNTYGRTRLSPQQIEILRASPLVQD
jgi:hypothetical protein